MSASVSRLIGSTFSSWAAAVGVLALARVVGR
jgi:hypothetical protein